MLHHVMMLSLLYPKTGEGSSVKPAAAEARGLPFTTGQKKSPYKTNFFFHPRVSLPLNNE